MNQDKSPSFEEQPSEEQRIAEAIACIREIHGMFRDGEFATIAREQHEDAAKIIDNTITRAALAREQISALPFEMRQELEDEAMDVLVELKVLRERIG